MERQHNDPCPPPERDGGPAYILECVLTEFMADMERQLGLQVRSCRYHAGRADSYSYHWHQPDEQGICTNLVCYGYERPLAALQAGLTAGIQAGLRPFPRTEEVEMNYLATVCQGDG